MVLSNAERQARYRQRLKEAAASTVLVRLFDGPFEDEAIIHDTRMAVVPRVGETLTIRSPKRFDESRYEVVAIDYLFDVREGVEISDDLTGVRVQVKAI